MKDDGLEPLGSILERVFGELGMDRKKTVPNLEPSQREKKPRRRNRPIQKVRSAAPLVKHR
jgi:hypothetical protein